MIPICFKASQSHPSLSVYHTYLEVRLTLIKLVNRIVILFCSRSSHFVFVVVVVVVIVVVVVVIVVVVPTISIG